ncbi:hypothetical protein EXIGLDRAFT_214438 [Exidia glandulosa HHB12029]|uniref:Uncharacterized protein n=1 Tax=Exidia glandulosa HHB12029 TaxID=1314781 RepID=A0A165MSE5_EXIGL|nr:hypothetical protein EXIGLDRAFT_214438 [Exidia glandulosa HHB12029]
MDYSPPFGRLPPPNRHAVRYFLVGFEQASRMPDGHVLFPVYDTPGCSISPELTGVHFDNLYPPFGVDVFLLGNVYKHRLLETYLGLEMISGLVEAMTCSDPWGRPGIRRALTHFRLMYDQVPWHTLHWRLWRHAETSVIESVGRDVGHAASLTLGAVRSILNINV